MLTLDMYTSYAMQLCMYVHVHVDVATEDNSTLVCNMHM